MCLPALPSAHASSSSTSAAGPHPVHNYASQLKDAEAKLSQACIELSVTKSQLQVLDSLLDAMWVPRLLYCACIS